MEKDEDKTVIQPDEIIIEEIDSQEISTSHVSPWTRFLARLLDYALFSLFLLSLVYFLIPQIFFHYIKWFVFINYLIWIPVEAILLSTWGYTPGKALLKTQLKTHYNKELSFSHAMRRAFLVWIKGMGMGLPVVSIITMLFAFSKLKIRGLTSWDRDEKTIITHYPVSTLHFFIAAVIIVLISLFIDFFYL